MRKRPKTFFALVGSFMSLALLASIFSYSYVTSRQEAGKRIEQMRSVNMTLTAELAHGCSRYLVLGDYAGLDAYLAETVLIPNIVEIRVVDADGFPLSEIHHVPGAESSVSAIPGGFAPPSTGELLLEHVQDSFVVTRSIVAGRLLGWVRVVYTMEEIPRMKALMWRNALIMSAVWVCISLLLALFLLRFPMQDISRLAGFAKGLASRKGELVEVPHSALELEQLGEALNYASAELRNADREILRERDRLKEAQGIAQMGNWELDHESGSLLWSEEIYRIFEIDPSAFGASYEAFLGLVNPADKEEVDRAYTESLRNRTPYEITHRLLMKDGRIKHVHECCKTFYDEHGAPLRSVGTVQDITERKKAEERLRQTNRKLRAISSCNQTLLRATDEKALLDDICSLICEEAGYSLAWVGYVEHDEERSIRPVAWAGEDSGYVANERMSWSEQGESGLGPAGLAVRSGLGVQVQDVATDPRMSGWRDEALRRGYRSGMALPMKDDAGATFGVMLIYHPMAWAMTPDEIALMEELAGDLAFGITVMRARKARDEAERRIEMLSFALDKVRESAFLIDKDGRLRYVNEESCRAMGYTRDELLGINVKDVDPDFPEGRWPDHWRELQERGSLLFEGRHRRKDGSVFPVEIYANYFEYSGEGLNLALVRDITERKRAERQTRLLEIALDRSGEAIYMANASGLLSYVSGEACRALGYSREELVGMTLLDIDPDLSAEELEGLTLKAGQGELTFERRHIRKDGTTFPVEIHTIGIEYDGVVNFFSSARDITERKRTEQSLLRMNERFALAADAAGLGVWDWDIQNNVLVWDDRMYELYGIGRDDFSGAYEAWLSGVHPEDRASCDEVSKRALAGDIPYDTEFRVVWPNGMVRHLKAFAVVSRDAEGRALRMTGVNFDITESRRMDEVTHARLRILEMVYSTNVSLDDVLRRTLDEIERLTNSRIGFYHFIDEDHVTLTLQNWSTNTMASMCNADGKGSHYPVSEAGVWADCVRYGRPVIHNNYEALPGRKGMPEGHARVVRELVVPIFRGSRIVAIIGVGNKPEDYDEADIQTVSLLGDFSWEIVERKKAEAELGLRELRYRTLVENIPTLIVRYNTDLQRIYVNPAWEEISGLSASDVINVPHADIAGVQKPVVEDYVAGLRKALESGTPQSIEFSWVNAKGATLYLDYRIVPEFDRQGKVVSLLAVGIDITERRRSEMERRDNLQFFESIDRINRIIQSAGDLDLMMSDALDAMLGIFGCDRAFLMYPCDPDAPIWSVPMERTRPEYPGALASGSVMPMDADVARTLKVLLASDGPVKFGPGTENPLPADVSERFGIKSFMSMAIRPKSGKPWQFGMHQCSHARQWSASEERLFAEIGHRVADALTGLMAFRDLRDSEAKLAEAQRIAHIGYWDRDIAAGRIMLSDESCRIFGLPDDGLRLDIEQWHGMWLRLLHPDDRQRVADVWAAALRGDAKYDVDYRVVRPDGSVRQVHSEANLTRDASGEVTRALGMMQDITERKQYEERIVRSLREKEVLLAEVHHRVKNNMAIISALLELQASAIDEEAFRLTLRELRQRIRSMALVHEKLYKSKDFQNIKVVEYVHELVRDLLMAYHHKTGEVSVDLDVQEIRMNMDTLIPFGLILNEIITNALKHAYEGTGQPPRLDISLRMQDGEYAMLTVSDNGPGMPDAYEQSRRKTLGLSIIRGLAAQLEGTLEIISRGGTTVKLIFPVRAEI